MEQISLSFSLVGLAKLSITMGGPPLGWLDISLFFMFQPVKCDGFFYEHDVWLTTSRADNCDGFFMTMICGCRPTWFADDFRSMPTMQQ